MKTIIALLLCIAIATPCSAPLPPPPGPGFTLVEIVLAATVIAIAGTAVYVVVKCAKKLDQPPTIEKSTNRVDWSTSGQMMETANGYEWSEPATNSTAFFRARR